MPVPAVIRVLVLAAYIRQLQQLTIFSRRAFSPGIFFLLAIVITSVILLLFYTLLEVYTKFGMEGGADKILDYADRPSFCLYSSGLSPPRDILIRFSRYQTI